MKKYLLAGTSALALSLTVGSASAADAGKFDIKISGDAYFEMGYLGQSWNTSNTTSKTNQDANAAAGVSNDRFGAGDFTNRFRLVINPEAKSDNGLTYGAKARLRAAGANNAAIDGDRAYIYVSGAFGQVQAGVVNGPSDATYVGHPADWQMLGIYDAWRAYAVPTGSNASRSNAYAWGQFQSNLVATQGMQLLNSKLADTKLVYYTPRFLGQTASTGLQGAISYTPQSGGAASTAFGNNTNVNTGVNRCDSIDSACAGSFQNVVEVTANYAEKWGMWSTKVSAGGSFGSAPRNSATTVNLNGTTGGNGYRGLESAQLGVQVGYQHFVLGGGFVWAGRSGQVNDVSQNQAANAIALTAINYSLAKQQDAYSWNIGAQYTYQQWVFGVKYMEQVDGRVGFSTTTANTLVNNERTLGAITTGVMYTVAPGLRTGLEYTHFEARDKTPAGTGADNFAANNPQRDRGDVILARGVVTF